VHTICFKLLGSRFHIEYRVRVLPDNVDVGLCGGIDEIRSKNSTRKNRLKQPTSLREIFAILCKITWYFRVTSSFTNFGQNLPM